jgi:hypothetical protein
MKGWSTQSCPYVEEEDDERMDHTAMLLRPFCRRRLSTLRPPGVSSRLRNPCLRFRRFTLGWYVLPRLFPPAMSSSYSVSANQHEQ